MNSGHFLVVESPLNKHFPTYFLSTIFKKRKGNCKSLGFLNDNRYVNFSCGEDVFISNKASIKAIK